MDKLSTIYPTQTDSSDPDWEHGAPKNVSTPTGTDGTPWETRLIRNLLGPFYAILKKASITPNDVAEKPTSSQVFTALTWLFGRRQDFYTGDATWTKLSWAKWIRVTVVGGGGSSAGGNSGQTGGSGSGYKAVYEGPADAFAATGSVEVGSGGPFSVPSSAGTDGGGSRFISGTVFVYAPGGKRGTTAGGGDGWSGGGGPGVSTGNGLQGGNGGRNGYGGSAYGAGVFGDGLRGLSGCPGGLGGSSASGGNGGGGGGGAMAGWVGPDALVAGGGTSATQGGRGGYGYGAGSGGAEFEGGCGPGVVGCVVVEQFSKVP